MPKVTYIGSARNTELPNIKPPLSFEVNIPVDVDAGHPALPMLRANPYFDVVEDDEDREALEAQAKELGLTFAPNIGTEKLQQRIDDALNSNES